MNGWRNPDTWRANSGFKGNWSAFQPEMWRKMEAQSQLLSRKDKYVHGSHCYFSVIICFYVKSAISSRSWIFFTGALSLWNRCATYFSGRNYLKTWIFKVSHEDWSSLRFRRWALHGNDSPCCCAWFGLCSVEPCPSLIVILPEIPILILWGIILSATCIRHELCTREAI